MLKVEISGTNEISNKLKKFGNQVEGNLLTELRMFGLDLEKQAKQDRPWTDRTGNARRSIRGSAAKTNSTTYTTALAIGVSYGRYLELSNGGRFRVILPTMLSNTRQFIAACRRAFR